MSGETRELFAGAAAAFNRRDLEGFIGHCDPEIEFTDFLMEIEGGGTFRGHEGVRAWWANYFATFPDLTQEIDELRALGPDALLVHGRTRGRPLGTGRGSASPFEQAFWLIVKLRDNKAVWWRSFRSEDEALEAVGPLA